jgi:hypothetical protein
MRAMTMRLGPSHTVLPAGTRHHRSATAGPAHGSLALVLILSAIAGIVGYVTFDSRNLETSVAAKINVYATNLTEQVYSARCRGRS